MLQITTISAKQIILCPILRNNEIETVFSILFPSFKTLGSVIYCVTSQKSVLDRKNGHNDEYLSNKENQIMNKKVLCPFKTLIYIHIFIPFLNKPL